MSSFIESLPLSALTPVEINYTKSTESLSKSFDRYSNGLQVHYHEALNNAKDVAFSKRNVLILTDVKNLKEVFESPLSELNLASFVGSCKLLVNDTDLLNRDTTIKKVEQTLYVGGKGEDVYFSILPLESGLVELRVGSLYVQRSQNYPYDITLVSSKQLDEIHYQFSVEVFDDTLSFKAQTNDGIRYLSYSQKDRKMRCVGTEFGEVVLNQYRFKAEFQTKPKIIYGYDPSSKEVKYFNSVETGEERKGVNIKSSKSSNNNLLLTLTTSDLLSSFAPANVCMLKTNYSTSGSYNASLT